MSYENPTPLRIGMTGTLHGWRVRIVGRVVLGMEDGGETYYWNEFNLVDESGSGGTLVHEETEDGVEWKLFTEFAPQRPMTAAEARTRRVGDTVHLDGKPTQITLVDESRVYHIEGTAPDGVQVGDVARYFNADAGERMLVASWTGDEIEFYEGRDLRADEVMQAFGVAAQASATTARFRGDSSVRPDKTLTIIIVAVLAAATLFAAYSCSKGRKPVGSAAPPAKQPAPTLQLAAGASGTLGADTFTIESQALVEIGRVGRRFERREYQVVNSRNVRALLVQGLNGGTKEWHLLAPVTPSGPLAAVPAYEAAAKRKGSPVNIGSRTMHVAELFLTKPAGASPGLTTSPEIRYGFVARDADEWLMARWTESALEFHQGRQFPEGDVLQAFGRAGAAR